MSAIRKARRSIANAVFTSLCWIAAAVALAALAAIFWSLFSQGFGGLNLAVFTQSTPAPGSPGGLMNAIVGSAIMCALAMLIAVAVGVMAGTWLAEYGRNGVYASAVRFVNDILLSAPSVLIGLVVGELMVSHLIGHFSALAGSVALALIAVPIITRTTEDVLKLQPTALRESGMALGAPHWTAIRQILWKSAGGGILTGGLLAFARISGETAPLLFTSLGNQFFSLDLTRPMASLPTTIANFALSAYDDWIRLAWVAALILSLAVLAANILARFLTPGARTLTNALNTDSFEEYISVIPPETVKLRTQNLDFFYGKLQALHAVSLPVVNNGVTALIGPSGCGKSTLLRVMNRIYALYPGQTAKGQVILDGQDILERKVDVASLRSRVGMVFQKPTPFPMSIYDNVAFGVRLYEGLSRAELDQRVEESLRKAALWDEVKDKLKQAGLSLSGGQQQRLCVARGIAVKPEVLLLDEPASALDPVSTRKLEETIVELKKDYTIVIVTHNLQQATRVSDNTGFMFLGRLIEFAPTRELFSTPRATRTADYIGGRFG